MKILAILVILGLSRVPMAFATVTEAEAITVILTEAGGESFDGKTAVAEVLRHRASTRGFCGLKRKDLSCFITKQGKRAYSDSQAAWRRSQTSNLTGGATHFENIKAFGVPNWAKRMSKTVTIGSHTFYREKAK